MKKRFLFIVVLGILFTSLIADTNRKYLVRTFIDKNGQSIDEIIVPGRPPENYRAPIAEVPQPPYDRGINIIPDVPAFDWCYGCSATSAAMMAGHYDKTIFPNMYTGPIISKT